MAKIVIDGKVVLLEEIEKQLSYNDKMIKTPKKKRNIKKPIIKVK